MNNIEFDNVLRHFFYSGRASRMSHRNGDVYLVVDNQPDDIFSICRAIENEGGKVFSASCLEEGKRAIFGLDDRLICVIVDHSNYDLVNWIKEKFPHLPIVLYTGVPGVKKKEIVENPQLTPVSKGDLSELLYAIGLSR